MVEFAIILPFLLLMLYGITEIGRALYQQNTLHKGLMAGARYLARAEDMITLDPIDNSCNTEANYDAMKIKAENLIASTVAEFPGFSTANIEIDVPGTAMVIDDVVGCKIVIQANAGFNALFIPLGSKELASFNIHAEIEERYIGR